MNEEVDEAGDRPAGWPMSTEARGGEPVACAVLPLDFDLDLEPNLMGKDEAQG